MSRFTRNDDEDIAKKIEERAKAYLSKTCRIDRSGEQSNRSFGLNNSPSPIRGDTTYNESSSSPHKRIENKSFSSKESPIKCASLYSLRAKPEGQGLQKFAPKVQPFMAARSQSVPKRVSMNSLCMLYGIRKCRCHGL